MTYRLWGTDVGRLFGAYETEEEALTLVRMLVGTYGAECAEDLSLSGDPATGIYADPLYGSALVARAEEVAAEKEHADARHGEMIGSGQSSGGHDTGLPLAADGYSRGPTRTRRHVIAPVRDRRRGTV